MTENKTVREWVRPKVIVITRNIQENVLAACKNGTVHTGAAGANSVCDEPAICLAPCTANIGS